MSKSNQRKIFQSRLKIDYASYFLLRLPRGGWKYNVGSEWWNKKAIDHEWVECKGLPPSNLFYELLWSNLTPDQEDLINYLGQNLTNESSKSSTFHGLKEKFKMRFRLESLRNESLRFVPRYWFASRFIVNMIWSRGLEESQHLRTTRW